MSNLYAQDYFPFGSVMDGRSYNNEKYRFGFNGKEKEDGMDGVYAFEARIFDSRIARWFSTDPREGDYAWQSTYAYYKNSPISTLDFLGKGGPYQDLDAVPDFSGSNNEAKESSLQDKFVALVKAYKPVEPALTVDNWKKSNLKPKRSEYNSRSYYKSAKKQYKKDLRQVKSNWINYSNWMLEYNYISGEIEKFAYSSNEIAQDIVKWTVASNTSIFVKNQSSLMHSSSDGSSETAAGLTVTNVSQDGNIAITIFIDFMAVKNGYFTNIGGGIQPLQSEASKKWVTDHLDGSNKKVKIKLTNGSVLSHELSHAFYRVARIKNGKKMSNKASEEHSIDWEYDYYQIEQGYPLD